MANFQYLEKSIKFMKVLLHLTGCYEMNLDSNEDIIPYIGLALLSYLHNT